jgi:membrane-associated protease RseP (regulator of RpoE activity)
VGIGGRGSLANTPTERKQVHNGADDNASGSAGVLEVAEYLAARRGRLRRDILFLTFTGEELGLLGSRYFVEHPTRPLERMVAMINMDMIGRLGGRKLFIGGAKTSPAWKPMLDRLTAELGVAAVFGDGGRAPSDNTSFYNKKMPVLFFFSGMHREYHRPADDWPLIDLEGIEKVARLAAAAAETIANLPERPKFQRADSGGMGPPRAVLGINIAPAQGGVAIRTIVPAGPAARAGIREGDVIVAVAGSATPDPATLRAVMRKRQPGEEVTVKVRRGDETLEFTFKLGRG